MTLRAALAAGAIAAAGLVTACTPDIPAATAEARYANAQSQFVTLRDGSRLHVRDEGPRDGPVVVLLHGSNASLHTWEAWVSALSDRYRVITFDFPGHGLTGPTPVADYTAERYAAVIDELTEGLGVRRFALGGNSMGGAMTWYYALQHPDKVQALILVNAAGYPRADGSRPLIFQLAAAPVIGDLFSRLTNKAAIERNLKEVMADDAGVTPELVTRYTELLLREGNRKATLTRFRTPPRDPDAYTAIPTIAAPTLILWGDLDPWIPVADARRFEAEIKGSRAIVYEGVGHVPQDEIPERSAADVRAFLDGVFAAAPAAQSPSTSPME